MNTTNASFPVGDTKSKLPARKKKTTVGKAAKLKSSRWYEVAARSIGITKRRALESRGDMLSIKRS
jgi:hypothetical protein